MIGIPIDLHPSFPTNANLVLLTESATFDTGIVAKIKGHLAAGKSVVITSGLLRALQGRGIEDIVEARCTERRILTHEYLSSFGAGNSTVIGDGQTGDAIFPAVDFLTNDAWALVRALADGKGYPLLFMDRYSKGVLYVWTMPDNFNNLYRLPPSVTSAVKDCVMNGFPVRLDGPNQVALFAYDNNTFIVESYLHSETDVKVSVLGGFGKLRNLLTGEVLNAEPQADGGSRRVRQQPVEQRDAFKVHLPPHSYSVFAAEQ
jgi:hypothetical protein